MRVGTAIFLADVRLRLRNLAKEVETARFSACARFEGVAELMALHGFDLHGLYAGVVAAYSQLPADELEAERANLAAVEQLVTDVENRVRQGLDLLAVIVYQPPRDRVTAAGWPFYAELEVRSPPPEPPAETNKRPQLKLILGGRA